MKWLIWSIEHGAWWGPNHHGYVSERAEAGRYDFKEAKRIVERANVGLYGTPNEAMIEATEDIVDDEEYDEPDNSGATPGDR